MNPIWLTLLTTGCYTATSLTDKHASACGAFRQPDLTFLMCASMAVFSLPLLFLRPQYFAGNFGAFGGILAVAACKCTEFFTMAQILQVLSAFELKAWLSVMLFLSYITDLCMGTPFRLVKLACLLAITEGLILIARSGRKQKVPYGRIAWPLVLYILVKYGYGLSIRFFTGFASSDILLCGGMALAALAVLPFVRWRDALARFPGETALVVGMRVPNVVGMLSENALVAVSLTHYSMIQPLLLETLFVISVVRRERRSWDGWVGSLFCTAGLLAFYLL